jgi:tetratricopeptide (TPR) repeat protein
MAELPDLPELPENLRDPDVLFLPLALSADLVLPELPAGLDGRVLSRRLPDFVHQVLNQGQPLPTAMLELQTTEDDGPVHWLPIDDVPDFEAAFDLVPEDLPVRAVVAGRLGPADGGLRLEFHVYRDDDGEPGGEPITAVVSGQVLFADPVAGLLKLARHLARLLDLRFEVPPTGLLTRDALAFAHFLLGLDHAILLSGDLDIPLPDDREALIQPFAEALARDPRFGLALRLATATASLAFDEELLDAAAVARFLDRCYHSQPVDGDGCVAVAEQLVELGDFGRARQWLEHATHLDPPPPRGLEHLGMLLAKRGELDRAAALWQRGAELDGHPDFCSHLAQLAFAEGRDAEAWQHLRRGLWRLRERTLRAREWDDVPRRGILLRVVGEHLVRRPAPADILAALLPLAGLLRGSARAWLGLCLHAAGAVALARTELRAALSHPELDLDLRDRCARVWLQLDEPDFEASFAAAVEQAERGRDPAGCLERFQVWFARQPQFWPSLYYAALVERRLGRHDQALDLLAQALEIAPLQPDLEFAMAELFSARGNDKRALELIDAALEDRPSAPRFHAARVRYLRGLGRLGEAREHLRELAAAGVDSPELRKLRRALRR